ncbi:cytochrome C assembly family protein [Mariprofundus ferrooxydans]|uniref:cytochrome C assembly family protein n=1 Tax=Mariprofundus ferrooxydans TaxID=314344 RepID=UPI00143134B9|nr:cytochrome c biogenesis protein CcsA [Mariprofundus ferrooxydans]
MNSSLLFLTAGTCMLVASFIIWREALGRYAGANQQPANQITSLLAIAIGLNIWAVHLMDSFTANGINFTLATGVAVATLLVQGIYMIGIMRHGIRGLGLFLLPASVVPLILIPILPEAHTPNWVQTSSPLETGHLLISLLAYAVLTLAALHAVMQIMLDRALKKKRLTVLVQALPSLFDIERHMMAQVKIATVLVALSVFSGLSWQWMEFQHFAILNHKVLLALFSFGILILLLIKRHYSDWPTRIVSRTVIGAYFLLMLAYFGVSLIKSWMY